MITPTRMEAYRMEVNERLRHGMGKVWDKGKMDLSSESLIFSTDDF